MSVIAVEETWDAREGSVDVRGRLSARRSFRVIVDEARTPIPDIVTAVDPDTSLAIPTVGSLHPEDFALYCSAISPKQRYKNAWEVIADYSNENSTAEEPEDDEAVIEWSADQFQKPAVVDRDGAAILNAAGDFFDPPPEMDDSRWTCTVRKNVTFIPSWLTEYRNSVNDATFNLDGISIAAGCAKLSGIAIGRKQQRNGTTFRELTMVFHIDEDGWSLKTLNRGFRYKSGSVRIQIAYDDAGTVVAPYLPNANIPSEPVLLAADGSVLPNPTAATATYITSDVYKEKDFSVLPLT